MSERARIAAGGALMDRGFRLLARIGRLHPDADPHKHGLEVLRDIPYRPTGRPEHTLDVYRPRAARNLPVIFYVHGGGFKILDKETHWLPAMVYAVRNKAVVINVNYRLAPTHRYPAAIEDVCDAWRWTLDHVDKLGGDPRRIAVAGESAGANLVSALVLCTTFDRPEPYAQRVFDTGVVPRVAMPAAGIHQVTGVERFRKESWRGRKMPWFLVDRIEDVGKSYLPSQGRWDPEELELADPLRVYESDRGPDRPLPPFYLPVGGGDPIRSDTVRLGKALRVRGVASETRVFGRETHAFHIVTYWRRAAKQCWDEMTSFAGAHL